MSLEESAPVLGQSQETPVADTAPVAQPVQQQEPDDYAIRMSHLAKRERKLQEIANKNKQLEDTVVKYNGYKERASKGDIKAAYEALQDLGISYEQLTDHLIEDQSPEAVRYKSMEKQIEDLKLERQKEKEEAQVLRAEQANDHFKATIQQEANKDPDKYELSISTYGDELADTAFNMIVQDWEQRGRPRLPNGAADAMSHQDALSTIEDYLDAQYKESVLKLKSKKKLQSLFGNPVDVPAQQQSTTLGAFGSPSLGNAVAPMSLEERKAAAIRALKG